MNLTLTKKILLSVLGLGVVGSLVGMGTFASFTATASNPSNTFTTGTLTLDTLNASGNSVGGASFMSLSSLKPGDTKSEFLTIKNTGSLPIASYTLATSASTSSLLDTDTTNGLKLTITRCSVAWDGTATSPTCADGLGGLGGGTTETNFNAVPIVKGASGIGTANLAPNGSNFYHIRVSLPSGADNTFQGKTSTILFTWLGEQQTSTDQ